ncbi:uncharacterized protein BcabD6B2_37420 [Babesia caballi]|uniref:Uncharacterized protein n=1 Tax=Babesia caballi TaxID=5871 RepID=A0AAV4LWW6_BABCB|nr:hypothetical protein BcabD6B2_37420 [Babesia caballi]
MGAFGGEARTRAAARSKVDGSGKLRLPQPGQGSGLDEDARVLYVVVLVDLVDTLLRTQQVLVVAVLGAKPTLGVLKGVHHRGGARRAAQAVQALRAGRGAVGGEQPARLGQRRAHAGALHGRALLLVGEARSVHALCRSAEEVGNRYLQPGQPEVARVLQQGPAQGGVRGKGDVAVAQVVQDVGEPGAVTVDEDGGRGRGAVVCDQEEIVAHGAGGRVVGQVGEELAEVHGETRPLVGEQRSVRGHVRAAAHVELHYAAEAGDVLGGGLGGLQAAAHRAVGAEGAQMALGALLLGAVYHISECVRRERAADGRQRQLLPLGQLGVRRTTQGDEAAVEEVVQRPVHGGEGDVADHSGSQTLVERREGSYRAGASEELHGAQGKVGLLVGPQALQRLHGEQSGHAPQNAGSRRTHVALQRVVRDEEDRLASHDVQHSEVEPGEEAAQPSGGVDVPSNADCGNAPSQPLQLRVEVPVVANHVRRDAKRGDKQPLAG